MMESEKIDFFITWVDGSRVDWLAEKRRWEHLENSNVADGNANSDCRYRDNGWLRYWFRGVEKYASWVNRIHFVTNGQKPDWLNENHPKLNLVHHEDFIPANYLPTFCSRTIELNSHRISGLTEKYVIFNDDVFLLQPVSQDFFFRKGNPVLITDLRYPDNLGLSNSGRVLYNDSAIINDSFDVGQLIWKNRRKWFNGSVIGYKRALRNFACYLANQTLPVRNYGHLALPQLKSTFDEIWTKYPDILDASCRHRFRADDQVNIYLVCAWNQVKGNFYPAEMDNLGSFVGVDLNNVKWVCEVIKKQSFPQICINEVDEESDNGRCMKAVSDSFDRILPDKSGFEK